MIKNTKNQFHHSLYDFVLVSTMVKFSLILCTIKGSTTIPHIVYIYRYEHKRAHFTLFQKELSIRISFLRHFM